MQKLRAKAYDKMIDLAEELYLSFSLAEIVYSVG